jgi:SAM-dependent methyltransferase
MVARAARRKATHGVSFVCADFMEFELPPVSFDCVVSAATLHHMPQESAISRMLHLLRDGGRLILHDLRRNANLLEAAASAAVFTADYFATLVSSGVHRESAAARRAWKKHGQSESYLSFPEVVAMTERLLPNATVLRHALWRYTVIWDKPAGGPEISRS